jgi:hypothetical protein
VKNEEELEMKKGLINLSTKKMDEIFDEVMNDTVDLIDDDDEAVQDDLDLDLEVDLELRSGVEYEPKNKIAPNLDKENDDLFIATYETRKSNFAKGEYSSQVGKLNAERVQGDCGIWIKVTIPFLIRNPRTTKLETVNFTASKNLDPKKRLHPIVCGILGTDPGFNFDLRRLEGKKVKVRIGHHYDGNGNEWEEIVHVRPL